MNTVTANTNEVKVINWFDIKDDVKVINENTPEKRITACM